MSRVLVYPRYYSSILSVIVKSSTFPVVSATCLSHSLHKPLLHQQLPMNQHDHRVSSSASVTEYHCGTFVRKTASSLQARDCQRLQGSGCRFKQVAGYLQLCFAVTDSVGASLIQFFGKNIEEDTQQARRCRNNPWPCAVACC